MLKRPEQIIEKTGIDSAISVANVLKTMNESPQIKDDGRIKIVAS